MILTFFSLFLFYRSQSRDFNFKLKELSRVSACLKYPIKYFYNLMPKMAVKVLINRSNSQKYRSMTLFADSRALIAEKNVYQPHYCICLVEQRFPINTGKGLKFKMEEQISLKMQKKEHSRSLNHTNPGVRLKTSSLPKSMKLIDKGFLELHGFPHAHLREEMKLIKINLGWESLNIEVPEIHLINKKSSFELPYRHS